MTNEILQMDTYLFPDGLTSKHNDDDCTEVMSMRWYVNTMDSLVEKIGDLSNYGIDNSTDESIKNTQNISVPLRFTCDIVKNIIVQHTKNVLDMMNEHLEYEKSKN